MKIGMLTFDSFLKALLFLLVQFALLSGTSSSALAKRVALVIGNSNYENIQSLDNPENDARLISKTLGEAGFEVRQLIDGDYREMKKQLIDFGRVLRDNEVEAGLIYYAGHGVQVRGENYLIPVNAQLSDEDEIDLEGINVNDFLRVMDSSNSPVNIVVLDACRNNPFRGSFRAATRGLAPVDAPQGTLIAYATSPGQVALDGATSNSPYTAALSRAISTSAGQPIESVFKQARRDVLFETNDKQVPWEVSSITGDFFFFPEGTPAGGASPDNTQTSNLDIAYWTAIRGNPSAAELRAYLEKFPDGLFADIANTKLKDIETAPQQLASLTPSDQSVETVTPIPTDPKEITRTVQAELNRLGCDAGNPDGVWGPRSARALKTLEKEAQTKLASLKPNASLLKQLRTFETRVCPIICSARYELQGDQCVLKTCPAGQQLSSKGKCYTKSQATQPSAAPSSNCFVFNGQRYCN